MSLKLTNDNYRKSLLSNLWYMRNIKSLSDFYISKYTNKKHENIFFVEEKIARGSDNTSLKVEK